MKGPIISIKGRDKPESPYSKVDNSVVYGPQLRCLSFGVSYARRNQKVPTHLIVGNSFLKLFNEFHHLSGIPRLAFFPQLSRSLLDLFQCPVKIIGKGGQVKQSVSVPGQLHVSLHLLEIRAIDRCRGKDLLEPVEVGCKLFNILLDVFGFLRPSISAVGDSYPLDRYLIARHECVHLAEGGLEGREPIDRLFHNIEWSLHISCNYLLLCYEPLNCKLDDLSEGVETTQIGLNPSYSQRRRSSSAVAFEM